MQTQFSEDVIPLSDLKVNPGKVIKHAKNTHRPVLLTSRGRGVAVVQGLDDYENIKEELEFVKAMAQGLMEIKEGDTSDVDDVKKQLGLQLVKISFSKSVIDDLKAIKEQYSEQGASQIGQDIVATIVKHIETLNAHPDIGRVVAEFNDESIHELIHNPFRVVYLRGSDSINVIRVWRSERLLKLSEP